MSTFNSLPSTDAQLAHANPRKELDGTPVDEKLKCGENGEIPTFKLTVLREEDAVAVNKEFKEHVIKGLSKPFKALSSMFFYDDRGSELYAAITELEEYYLTRTEQDIFEMHATDIAESLFSSLSDEKSKTTVNLVELGAGDGRKTKTLLEALFSLNIDFEYIPIDISRRAMTSLFECMGRFFSDKPLKVHGVIGEYIESVRHIVSEYPSRRTVVLFIGSSIGNFHHADALSFLKGLRAELRPRDVLMLGTDLRKDTEIMNKAYSDSSGITKEFNFNLLRRMNRELGTNFDVRNFQHLVIYNPVVGAMESYLLATKPHQVTMTSETPDKIKANTADDIPPIHKFTFKAFEPLYLECSHKYTIELVEEMLQSAGYLLREKYLDRRQWFMDCISVVGDI